MTDSSASERQLLPAVGADQPRTARLTASIGPRSTSSTDYYDLSPTPPRRKTTTEIAQTEALSLLHWRIRLMGIDTEMPRWARSFGLCLFLFSITGFLAFVIVELRIIPIAGFEHRGWEYVMSAIASFGSCTAWIFCWCIRSHVSLEAPSEKVRARVLLNEVVMFVASLLATTGLVAAKTQSPGKAALFLVIAIVITLPYHVFVELLQVQCVLYEEAIKKFVEQIESGEQQSEQPFVTLIELRQQLRSGSRLFALGIVINSLVCATVIVIGMVMVLYSRAGELKILSYLGLSLFYTIVLMAQLLPLAVLNNTALKAAKLPLLDLDELVCAPAVAHTNLVSQIVRLNVLQANPPVLDVLRVTITPYVLVRACLSIGLGNTAAVLYSFLQHSV